MEMVEGTPYATFSRDTGVHVAVGVPHAPEWADDETAERSFGGAHPCMHVGTVADDVPDMETGSWTRVEACGERDCDLTREYVEEQGGPT
jgi:hypothetical protein